MSKFIIYARKSTESEDRQVLSIDSQTDELQKVAGNLGYGRVEVMRESMSAKAPGRPVFNKLMELVEAGKIAGILCWKLDRLARNPVDGGRIIWDIKNCGLRIITPSQTYSREDDNTILMYVEFGMAQKFIDDLGKNVKRGNRAKLDSGWLPGSAPLGYLNKLDDHTIIPDPERFPLIRKIWDLLLTGAYNPEQARQIANREWGFRTKKTKRSGGRPLSKSVIYKLVRNPFYYGVIERRVEGELRRYQGAHQSMITEEEFWRVQKILGNPVPKPQKKQRFAFTGLIRCGECGCMVTAEEHTKKSGRHYAYYRCTKKRQDVRCGQKMVSLDEIERQVNEILGSISIPKAFAAWGVKWLRYMHDQECTDRSHIYRSVQDAYNDVQAKLDRLTDMRLSDLLTDDEYSRQKERLVAEQRHLKERMGDTEQRAESWLKKVEEAFDFAQHAQYWFAQGNIQEKRNILVKLGSNAVLKDGIVRIELNDLWKRFGADAPAFHEDMRRLVLTKDGLPDEKTAAFTAAFPRW
ncbi:recombinase family protein [Candidatus Uhrbacteria bacterium]|nr:recombinase family protein [Candidatus Uhrbacteria bacterium]